MYGAHLRSPLFALSHFMAHSRDTTVQSLKCILLDFSLCIYLICIHKYMLIFECINCFPAVLCIVMCCSGTCSTPRLSLQPQFLASLLILIFMKLNLLAAWVFFALVFLSSHTSLGGRRGKGGEADYGLSVFSPPSRSSVGWSDQCPDMSLGWRQEEEKAGRLHSLRRGGGEAEGRLRKGM